MRFCGRALEISNATDSLGVEDVRSRGARARLLPLDEILPLLRDPLTKAPLAREGQLLTGGVRLHPIVHGNPVLFPCDMQRVRHALEAGSLMTRFPGLSDVEQYCAFGLLKAANNNNNLDFADAWYGRHLHRASRLVRNARGRFLDVGCDDVFLSRGMLPSDVEYVGLEPSDAPSPAVRVGGLGEFLPFATESFDGVAFQTSLDHILDYQLALAEARRVLRPGGRLYLATLLWVERAQLHTDTVHFHHFRPAEIEAALQGWRVEEVEAYVWKDNTHRYGAYLSAVKE